MNGKTMPQLLRKPPWLKVRPPYDDACRRIRATLSGLQLHTVCQEAACPNMAECFACGTATFLLLGNTCTRNCLYCNVAHGRPLAPDEHEISRLITAVKKMKLQYVVLTSVTRDDLKDGGASIFADAVSRLRGEIPGCRIEVLIPDFCGDPDALKRVTDAAPDVINHNLETAKPLFDKLRPQGNYRLSLELLSRAAAAGLVSKSGFMVGFGERKEDILSLMDDLAAVSCARLTIGQYQQPTRQHWPVARYYSPGEFEEFRAIAYSKGFKHVESGPLVRSSYHASRADSRPSSSP
jgi:lipoic acid synthetase